MIKNAKALEESFKALGVRMVSGGTDNHLLLLDFADIEMTGAAMEDLLGQSSITVNKNMVPRDRRSSSVTSGIRIGTPAVTTRGMKEEDMRLIAGGIADILARGEEAVPQVRNLAQALTARYPLYN